MDFVYVQLVFRLFVSPHAVRVQLIAASRTQDQSEGCALKGGKPFHREFSRFNNPVLPVEDYDQTIEIVQNLYTVYTHGHGQFHDQKTKELICTFHFEDLETMTFKNREQIQEDIDTIMMATKIYRHMPVPPQRNHCSGSTSKEPDDLSHSTRHPSPSALSPLTSLASSDDQVATPGPPTSSQTPSHPNPGEAKTRLTTNGALLHGDMYCFGQRPGYDAKVLYAPYMPRFGNSLRIYASFLRQLNTFGERLGTRFKSFADNAFSEARELLQKLQIPPLASVHKESNIGPLDFLGNFVCTFNNFYNLPHTDNDKGKVFCTWFPFDSANGKIVTKSQGFYLEGGWLLFPEYRIAFDFGLTSEVKISWNGKQTFHHTLQSKEKDAVGPHGQKVHYTRLGCSTQITSRLARAAAKLGTPEQFNQSSNCPREILDCHDILALEGRKWLE